MIFDNHKYGRSAEDASGVGYGVGKYGFYPGFDSGAGNGRLEHSAFISYEGRDGGADNASYGTDSDYYVTLLELIARVP